MRVTESRMMTIFLWTISILWLAMCLYLSWQPGDKTGEVSEAVAITVKHVIHFFGIEMDQHILNMRLRKAAHVIEFFVAAALLDCAFRASLYGITHACYTSVYLALLVCVVIAVIAEVGKLWIPGRHLQWDEVLLNITGVLFGAGIAFTVGMLVGK